MTKIRVSVVGAKGRMGKSVCEAVENSENLELALTLDLGDSLDLISKENTDVVVEFTIPDTSFDNVQTLVKNKVDVVVGTTGWNSDKIASIESLLQEGQSVLIAPNFSISAVLLERFAKEAAPYFESVEVVEMHHPDKLDAPSGTARSTASSIAKARLEAGFSNDFLSGPDKTTKDELGTRGGKVDGIPVHAIRLRGLNAHELVLFGNPGEQMEIRQDSFTRESFMPGILKAIDYVSNSNNSGLIFGLDKIL
ncbi:MAG: 4-hydroxy-tetrahydrodipicolinate reductase [Candidatus Ancillula sp.]|jgi:4-hydroxy-tetrahydrodipicolinate reductase|nr:4-hydroxy-tetrahydrodipicolinate reductase [Candidatus Ancillula sp.]